VKQLVAFVGFQGSGKNTAAEALYPLGFIPFSFADALKDMLAAVFCWDRDLLEGVTEASRTWREKVDPWWSERLGMPEFSPRWALRNIGTNLMRWQFNDKLWVFNVERRLMLVPDDASVVLIDGRFPAEIELAHRYGGKVICIQRGADPDWTRHALIANHHPDENDRQFAKARLEELYIHPSEYAWVGGKIDQIIENDGTVAALHKKVIKACR
jgi:hypothetical protein